MPPPVPVYALDCNGVTEAGLASTRAGTFFAELKLVGKRFSEQDMAEFGEVVYGPARQQAQEAEIDLVMLKDSANDGAASLRRVVAKLGALGGTRSFPNPSITPVLAGMGFVKIELPCDEHIVIKGVRRTNVSILAPADVPVFLFSRIVDILTDVLSCAVDSQLGIAPSTEDLLALLNYAISREKGTAPISDTVLQTRVIPLIENMKLTPPWSVLEQPRPGTDDAEVIHGFMNQMLDKSRRADMYGEKKQIKRLRKEVRDRKKTAHTLFVSNFPQDTTEDQLFQLFNSGVPGLINPVYKVKLPMKTYAFVTCRSAKATRGIIEHKDWVLEDKKLYVARKSGGDESPSQKRQRSDSADVPVPESIAVHVCKVLGAHSGCNISRIPELLKDDGVVVDPHALGFRNLAHLLQSIHGVRLEQHAAPGSFRPVYHAYIENP